MLTLGGYRPPLPGRNRPTERVGEPLPTKKMGAGVEIAIGEDPDGSWLEFMLAPR
jgi:hypothetical protein